MQWNQTLDWVKNFLSKPYARLPPFKQCAKNLCYTSKTIDAAKDNQSDTPLPGPIKKPSPPKGRKFPRYHPAWPKTDPAQSGNGRLPYFRHGGGTNTKRLLIPRDEKPCFRGTTLVVIHSCIAKISQKTDDHSCLSTENNPIPASF